MATQVKVTVGTPGTIPWALQAHMPAVISAPPSMALYEAIIADIATKEMARRQIRCRLDHLFDRAAGAGCGPASPGLARANSQTRLGSVLRAETAGRNGTKEMVNPCRLCLQAISLV